MYIERAGRRGPRLLLVHGSLAPGWGTWEQQRPLAADHRLVVVHEAVKTLGVGAEVAATTMEEAFDDLDAPVIRVGAHDIPIPFNDALERETTPTVDRIVDAVQKVVG